MMNTLILALLPATCLVLTAATPAAPGGPSADSAAESVPGRDTAQGETVRCAAGDLEAVFRRSAEGVLLETLRDARTQTTLATATAPLFSLTIRRVTGEERTLVATEGWQTVRLRADGHRVSLRWSEPSDPALSGLSVRAAAALDHGASAFRWTLDVENRTSDWCVRTVVFPQLDLADLGDSAAVLFPRGPGEVQRGLWHRDFQYRGNYPDGWCCLPFMAAYREGESPTGLYVGIHDPWGSTKRLLVKSSAATHSVRFAFEVPVENLNQPSNEVALDGYGVWQLLRGDWYDASMLYRAWARRHARWWPSLTNDGRRDTPLWMRELSAWVMTGGAPADCMPAVKRFREALGLPIGFHWYNWHQIPFDNDYPHYFPTKPGFAADVAELQQAGVSVMPYINGRLWDSHDRGAEDFEFSRLALPAATKQEDGQPYLETYGSKETNGQPVRLGVMCPTTRLWRKTVRDIVLRLQRDEGTRGVYIDQIAAAAPTLCMDAGHGHPLGGGHWWTTGYWGLLDAIRRALPAEGMLTTECNAEPFIRWFDGYLTWHWQFDGQVPVFPAIYGGTIQMFGRAYRGGATQDLALRMKAGQQLVFGEQIGWFDPALASEPQNFEFLRQIIRTRWNHRRFFYAGEMARPPRLSGDLPKVKADWQWSGEWPVTTDAVLTGAWRIPREHRLLLLFANVSDTIVRAPISVDPRTYGLGSGPQVRWVSVAASDQPSAGRVSGPWTETLELPPQSVQAWEIAPASKDNAGRPSVLP